MKQVTECFAVLEDLTNKVFLISNSYDAGVIIFVSGFGNKFVPYSYIKRIVVRERVL